MIDAQIFQRVNNHLSRSKSLIPVGVSNRHVHLSSEDVGILFGEGYLLTPLKPLRQPGQFAAQETLTVVGPKGSLQHVRVLGPTRSASQLELSRADCFALGINAPIRESGALENAGNALLVGPAGHVELRSQVICAWRHIHMSPLDASRMSVCHGQKVSVRSEGQRGLIFDAVIVRVDENYVLECHLDIEEANAAGLSNGERVTLVQ